MVAGGSRPAASLYILNLKRFARVRSSICAEGNFVRSTRPIRMMAEVGNSNSRNVIIKVGIHVFPFFTIEDLDRRVPATGVRIPKRRIESSHSAIAIAVYFEHRAHQLVGMDAFTEAGLEGIQRISLEGFVGIDDPLPVQHIDLVFGCLILKAIGQQLREFAQRFESDGVPLHGKRHGGDPKRKMHDGRIFQAPDMRKKYVVAETRATGQVRWKRNRNQSRGAPEIRRAEAAGSIEFEVKVDVT